MNKEPSLLDTVKHAMQLHAAGRFGDAEAVYRQILTAHPGEPFVTHLLGTLEMQTGRLEPAIIKLEAAVSCGTPRVEWHAAAVNANAAAGRIDRAIHWQQRMLALRPNSWDGHFRLSELFAMAGRHEESIEALNEALKLGATSPAICRNNLGVNHQRLRRFDAAAAEYRSAIALQPDYAIAHRNLGDALRELGDYPAAEQSYRNAIQFEPAMAGAHNGLGLTFYLREQFTEATGHFHEAMRLNPADADPCINLVLCYGRLGDHDQIERTLRRAMELTPTDAAVHSTLVMLMNYTRGHELPAIFNESVEFDRRHAASLLHRGSTVETRFSDGPEGQASQRNSPSSAALRAVAKPAVGDQNIVRPNPEASVEPSRPLRIGYISPDFRHHPVAIFLLPLLRHHDHSRFTIACYSNVERPDEMTARLKPLADIWRDIAGQSDDDVAQQIRADQIDILIDLAGHTVDNRLLVMARKPAPIQATWLGYPNTTGLSAIDYRITDEWADPPGTELYYAEKLVRLPDVAFVYEPPQLDVPVSPLPMLSNGFVTFGSFNNVVKITPAIGRLWSQILRQTPGARLLIAGIAPDAQARILSFIVGPDVSPDRIEFPQIQGFEAFLRLHHRVDIALDSFPYAGHTTTCNSLWMGVPVVCLAGPTAVSRIGVTLMANLEMRDRWVATTEQNYVQIAIDRTKAPNEIGALRAGLRERMRRSMLTDAARFAANFEAALVKLE